MVKSLKADEFKFFDLDEVSVQYRKFFDNSRYYPTSNIPGSKLNEGVTVNVDSTVFKYGFVKNSVVSTTDQSQFRSIGWMYNLGMRVSHNIDLSLYHFSEHTIDTPYPITSYPTMTGVELKIYLFKDKKNDSIF